ncbi:hypothetical protein Psta_0891 [Pirellula staleyi DSM 6068]|uniref:Uncharacterized protein n=1 Tax=Pirellula staleyi (strain ATCC 27377 / DSM 6068 / ICPB 4128) TaxID=530564 RepID=D2R780_PIRSD|nr:hypothetical protein [Pirellula staleyi]ADB15576.1 hypothetical protein Psta_0891 [Pirellula staleyi DSM 6068]
MITIFDRQPTTNRLPIGDLVLAIIKHLGINPSDQFEVIRIGGVGENIAAIESKLDDDKEVSMSAEDLLGLATSPVQFLDELHCANKTVSFGLQDATFLFVQAVDKVSENKIASTFQQVRFLADRSGEGYV